MRNDIKFPINNYKYLSVNSYEDFPVYWDVFEDNTSFVLTELFEIRVDNEVNADNVEEIVLQLIVELHSDTITIH